MVIMQLKMLIEDQVGQEKATVHLLEQIIILKLKIMKYLILLFTALQCGFIL